MRILFLFLLTFALFAEEWREPDAQYRLTVIMMFQANAVFWIS